MVGEPPSASDCFREIFEQHADYLRRAAVRLSGDREIAKDLVQETLARGLSHFDKFEQGTNARAWLAKILTRLYLDQLKHEAVVTRAKLRLAPVEVVDGDIDTAPDNRDAAVAAAVQRLEPDLRQVVEWRYMQDMSYKQIADKLSLPIGTVSTRLQRARLRLKELLTAPDAETP